MRAKLIVSLDNGKDHTFHLASRELLAILAGINTIGLLCRCDGVGLVVEEGDDDTIPMFCETMTNLACAISKEDLFTFINRMGNFCVDRDREIQE